MKLKDLIEQYGEYTVPQELIEKLEPPKPKSVWDLKDGDPYVFLEDDGRILASKANFIGLTKGRIDNGNAFLTINEAEKERERRKVENLLLKHGGRRWFKNHKHNWFIALENEVEDNPRTYNATSISKQGAIYFDSEEAAEKAIEEIGEKRIKDALFEVR